MIDIFAKAMSFTHPGFRFGFPHLREPRVVPIRTNAHYILFDLDKVSPLFTWCHVTPENREVKVARVDNFYSGDLTLDDEHCTTEADYEAWNKEHPEFPVHKGHSLGSQFMRSDELVQSDVDTLAGCTPESGPVNSNVKGPLESAIKEHCAEVTQACLMQGPCWYGNEKPVNGKLRNGQWIPDSLWISAVFQRKKTVEAYAWIMANTADRRFANLREIPVAELSRMTGIVMWDNVGSGRFQESLTRLRDKDWWKKGQPQDDEQS